MLCDKLYMYMTSRYCLFLRRFKMRGLSILTAKSRCEYECHFHHLPREIGKWSDSCWDITPNSKLNVYFTTMYRKNNITRVQWPNKVVMALKLNRIILVKRNGSIRAAQCQDGGTPTSKHGRPHFLIWHLKIEIIVVMWQIIYGYDE